MIYKPQELVLVLIQTLMLDQPVWKKIKSTKISKRLLLQTILYSVQIHNKIPLPITVNESNRNTIVGKKLLQF